MKPNPSIELLIAELVRRIPDFKLDCNTNNEAVIRQMVTGTLKPLTDEITRLREGLSKVAKNLGNGSAASLDCSLEFLCDSLPEEVRLVCTELRELNRGILVEYASQKCTMPDGTLDSCALSGDADVLRQLARLREVEITHENGRRVIAKWLKKPVDTTQAS